MNPSFIIINKFKYKISYIISQYTSVFNYWHLFNFIIINLVIYSKKRILIFLSILYYINHIFSFFFNYSALSLLLSLILCMLNNLQFYQSFQTGSKVFFLPYISPSNILCKYYLYIQFVLILI